MTCMPRHDAFDLARAVHTTEDESRRKRSLLDRLRNAMIASRQRRADRQIARILAQSGGRMTDAIERDVMERLFTNDWSVRS